MSNSNKGKPLTLELVFNKTKSDNLNNIKNLNLWGNDLEDLQLIEKMPNLEVISLSVNKINSLKDFAKCNKLHELYLRKNCITDLRQIKYLVDLPHLKSLWLYDNPCAQHDNYREIVIHHLPNITKLDNNMVTQEERVAASNPKFNLDFSNFSSKNIPQVQMTAPSIIRQVEVNQSEIKKPRPFSQLRQQRVSEQNVWKAGSSKQVAYNQYQSGQQQLNRNKNILIAVLSLIKELDAGSLQIVRKQVERELKER